MSPAVVRWEVLVICLVPLSFPLAQLSKANLAVPVLPLATLTAIVGVGLQRLARRLPIVARSPLMLALGVLVTSSLVSTLVAADPGAAVRLDGGYLLGLGLAGATVLAATDRRAARLLIGFVCLIGTVVCAQGILTAAPLKVHYGGTLVENRASGLFVQPNELGAFAALIVILSTALLLSPGRYRQRRLFAGASLAISVAAVMITLSRGAWLGLALGLTVLLVLAPSTRRAVLATLGALVGLCLSVRLLLPQQSLVSILADRAASFVDGQRNPYDDRPQIWGEAVRQVVERPWLGSGPGGYPFLASRSPSSVSWVGPDHAHNLFLTVAAEQGVLGVLALAAAVVVAVVGIARRARRSRTGATGGPDAANRALDDEHVLLAGVAGALAVVLGQGLLDYPLRNAVLAMLVWLLLGLLAALLAAPPGGAAPTSRRLGGVRRSRPAAHRRASRRVDHRGTPAPSANHAVASTEEHI